MENSKLQDCPRMLTNHAEQTDNFSEPRRSVCRVTRLDCSILVNGFGAYRLRLMLALI